MNKDSAVSAFLLTFFIKIIFVPCKSHKSPNCHVEKSASKF